MERENSIVRHRQRADSREALRPKLVYKEASERRDGGKKYARMEGGTEEEEGRQGCLGRSSRLFEFPNAFINAAER